MNKPTVNPASRALASLRGGLAATGVFSFAVNILMLATPLYSMQVYDRVLASRSLCTLLMLTLVTVGLTAFMAALELVRSRLLIRLGARFDHALSPVVFAAALRNRLQGLDGSPSQLMRDLEAVRAFLTSNGPLALLDAPWTPVFIAMIFVLHPMLGSIALGSSILLFSLACAGEFAGRKLMRNSLEELAAANSFADSSLRNAEVIAAMGMLPALRRRWLRHQDIALELQATVSDRSATVSAIARFARFCLQVGILGAGAYLAISQSITPGVMAAGSIMLGRALGPLEMAIGSWRGLIAARHAYERLRRGVSLADSPLSPMPLPKPSGALAVQQLWAGPPSAEGFVLKGISFALDPGEILGVIGPSASGKSTLARAIVGIAAVRSGHVRLDGADVAQWSREELGRYIGYLPQDVELFEGSIKDNIARFDDSGPEPVIKAARQAGVHEMILRLPHGYDTPLSDARNLLSGGQRQRVGLARALYNDPALVVLDEPNSNLDAAGEEALHQVLLELRRLRRTVVIIAHRPTILTNADKLLVLRDGAVDLFGARMEVMARLARAAAGTNQGSAPGMVPAQA